MMVRLAITQAPCGLFYIREVPFSPGRSIQATATTMEGAKWIVAQITGERGA